VHIVKQQSFWRLLTFFSLVDQPHENGDIPIEGIPSARKDETLLRVIALLPISKRHARQKIGLSNIIIR